MLYVEYICLSYLQHYYGETERHSNIRSSENLI